MNKSTLLLMLYLIVLIFLVPFLWNFVSPYVALGVFVSTIYLTLKNLKLIK